MFIYRVMKVSWFRFIFFLLDASDKYMKAEQTKYHKEYHQVDVKSEELVYFFLF